jgi:excisionase family DNA binding protein
VGSLPRTRWLKHDDTYRDEGLAALPVIESSTLPVSTIIAGERLVLTVAEAGALLGISRAFAYELVARGELPVIRLGRRIVVPKAALLQIVDSASRTA